MANDVFANGREISCKAAVGKSISAFPDVCYTPPQTPGTPPGVPIPYPNTCFASDTTRGSKTVKISGKEVMLKNKSYFKRSTGDEAGCAPLKGIITHKNTGKCYFTSWSMNVKVERQNVVRHLDLMTHNHASTPGNTIPWLYSDTMDVSQIPDGCKQEANNFNEKCGKHVVRTKKGDKIKLEKTNEAMCANDECKAARACILTPYNLQCCDGKTPHHVVPKSQFKKMPGKDSPYDVLSSVTYDPNKAPCICVEGTSHSEGDHGKIHSRKNEMTLRHPSVLPHLSASGSSISPDARWPVSEAEKVGAKSVSMVTDCKEKCIEDQARKGHENMGVKADDKIRPMTAGTTKESNTASAFE